MCSWCPCPALEHPQSSLPKSGLQREPAGPGELPQVPLALQGLLAAAPGAAWGEIHLCHSVRSQHQKEVQFCSAGMLFHVLGAAQGKWHFSHGKQGRAAQDALSKLTSSLDLTKKREECKMCVSVCIKQPNPTILQSLPHGPGCH